MNRAPIDRLSTAPVPRPGPVARPERQLSMIRVHALGGLCIRDGDGKPIAGPAAQPRRLAILALLARAGDRGVTRDKILAYLWPDAMTSAVRGRSPRRCMRSERISRRRTRSPGPRSSGSTPHSSRATCRSSRRRWRVGTTNVVATYAGPFLDGFYISGADEFSRWVERERSAIATEYSRALARTARAAGDTRSAVTWWRKLAGIAAQRPRDDGAHGSAAAGDRAAALQHARVYELLIEQELDLPPDRDVLAFAKRLRDAADEPRPASVAEPVAIAVRGSGGASPTGRTRASGSFAAACRGDSRTRRFSRASPVSGGVDRTRRARGGQRRFPRRPRTSDVHGRRRSRRRHRQHRRLGTDSAPTALTAPSPTCSRRASPARSRSGS